MKVENLGENAFILRMELGRGTYGKEQIEMSISANNSALIIVIGDTFYSIPLMSIAEDVCKFRDKEGVEGK